MEIMGTGLDFSTGKPLIGTIDEQAFSEKILGSFPHETLPGLSRAGTSAFMFRKEIEREHYMDLGDPRKAGWTFLVNGNDPQRDEIAQTMRPLAEHRNMLDPDSPLVYNGESEDDWEWWLGENYRNPDLENVPHYVLIVGGPDMVPFRFQSFLDILASVGRVHFDSIHDLETYIEKLIRLEEADSPTVDREVLYFATDGGLGDPTFFSKLHMAEPLAEHTRTSAHKGRIEATAQTVIGRIPFSRSGATPAIS